MFKINKLVLSPFLFMAFLFTAFFANAANERVVDVPKLHIEISVNYCFAGGAVLHAFNPLQSNNQAYYAQEHFLVVWKKNGQYVGTGTTLNCVCGGTFTVRITDLRNGYSEERTVTVGPCKGRNDVRNPQQ